MDFYEEVYRLVRQVPRGKVATYGQVAALISTPRAARQVGTALRALDDSTDVPWQRVISSRGIISIQNLVHPQEEQAALLAREGVTVIFCRGAFSVDLKKYLWRGQSD